MLTKIKSIKNTVERILRDEPETRDNDRLLMLKVWAVQNPHIRFHGYTFISFAKDFIKAGYADPESIRRARQKLQEENEALRGKSYRLRHDLGIETRYGIHYG